MVMLCLLLTALPFGSVEAAFGAEVPQYTYLHYVSGGVKADNTSDNNYTREARPVLSYLNEEEDGGFCNVQVQSGKLYIEKYSSAFKRTATKAINLELPIFGGYFRGEEYNFVVCGKRNPSQDNGAEVVRVIKYDRQWNRLGATSISNINTVEPFDFGSLRMAETGDTLFIHTCHLMYASSDGFNHQANMTFAVDKETMALTQQFSAVWNIASGYVSHSFNQFVLTDGSYVYRLDHGDAYPRSVVLTKAPVSSISSASNINILNIAGKTGDNYTGVSVGGFVQAGNYLLAAGNSIDQTAASFNAGGTRNVFVSVADTDLTRSKTTWLTKYGAKSSITVGTPQLVRGEAGRLYVLWEEYDRSTRKTAVRVAEIDDEGNLTAGPYRLHARLSDCQPIFTSTGHILWEVSKTGSTTFYDVEPSKLAEYEKETLSALPKKNAVVKVSGVSYKVTRASRTAGTVTYVAPKSKSAQSVVIPASVKIKGVSYKVTAVGANAFSGMKNLKQVTIGSNVATIGKGAFKNCRKLNDITIESAKLKKVNAGAIKGIHAKAVIKCPASRLSAYKKMFAKSTGYVRTMTLKSV